uniref:Uncharacterized protein n=1 Tax=Ditylenchus dipsaci TaxID=166011 RepID=A0A915D974_9BILA
MGQPPESTNTGATANVVLVEPVEEDPNQQQHACSNPTNAAENNEQEIPTIYPLNLSISTPTSSAYLSASTASQSLQSSQREKLNDKRKLHQTCFSSFLEFSFHNTGLFIADHPVAIILVILVFTTICSLKIPFTQQEDDIKTGYTPQGARSVVEAGLYEEFYGRQTAEIYNEPVSLVVFLTARDGGSMLREEHLNESVWLLDELGSNYPLAGQNFYQFCTDFCQINEPIKAFRNGLIVGEKHDGDGRASMDDQNFDVDNNYRINLTFPFISILGRTLDMSPHFFGLKLFENEQEQWDARSSTNIKFLKLIILQFQAERPVNVTKDQVTKQKILNPKFGVA